jgi:N-acetylmuramate 1-kinase
MSAPTLPSVPETTWVIDLPGLAATETLAREIARELGPDVLVTLTGDLGSGKTTFARALIRHLAGDGALEVPSPTFTLIQTYEAKAGAVAPLTIVHADLYRIQSPEELVELGWDEAAERALVLVEWADRAADFLPVDRLDIGFILEPEEGPDHRVAVVTGHGTWAKRVGIMKARERLLDAAGWKESIRAHMQGDASSRAYERLAMDGRTAILMISPKRPDGPPVRYGKPYSAIARLAEDVAPFVAMTNGLRSRGFNAPEILASDLRAGLLLIEDLGDQTVLVNGTPSPDRYAEAAGVLARLHAMDLPDRLAVNETVEHRIPGYDLEALGIELELLLDWYLPHKGKSGLAASARGTFLNLWKDALTPVLAQPRTWTLRDYHSPNLMWLAGRPVGERIGLIDYQDAVMGPAAYDVVSLLQDARVDVDQHLELRLLGHYAKARRESLPDFDMARFARDYSVMGAQRATKILGIFARLNHRDGKPQYLAHLPRIEGYVARCLAHPVLSELKAWYRQHVPGLLPDGSPGEG